MFCGVFDMSGDTGQQSSQPISRRDFSKLMGGLVAAWAFPGLANAGDSNQASLIKEGDIADAERITLAGAFTKDVEYRVNYLPSECAEYGGKLYQVEPQSIWWHWDGTATSRIEDHDLVQTTWYGLVGRAKRGDPVAAHFSVGPNTVLQMLPLSASRIIQGRLTDDTSISDIKQAKSLGGVQIETTGRWYDKNPPLECQTATLVDLTIAVMKRYRVLFPTICGHRERAARIPKPDPGVEYLKETRIRLLKTLIAQAQWPLIGHPDSWNFYMEVLRKGKVIRVPNQTKQEILSRLTEQEKSLIHTYIVEPSKPAQEHWDNES